MASIDPRKKESITNQANYLMTGITTLLMTSLFSSIQSGTWNELQYFILGGFWIMAFGAREIKKVVETWMSNYSESSKSPMSS